MENANVAQLPTAMTAPVAAFDFAPKTLDEALKLAEVMSKSTIVPKDYIDKPGNVLIAMQWGYEVGLKPLQAMQNIAVINGRPSIWGDSLIAIVLASPACEYIREGDSTDEQGVCRVKRRGQPEEVRIFTKADALKAGLLTKDGPWRAYPRRMLQMRARAWALRDVFPDVLRGMAVAEEVLDTVPKDVTADSQRLTPEPAAGAQSRTEKLKERVAVPLAHVVRVFDEAREGLAIERGVELAKLLKTEADKTAANDAYKRAVARIKASKAEAQPEPLTDEQLLAQIAAADSAELLDMVEGTIGGVEDETRRGLLLEHLAKRREALASPQASA